MQLSLPKIKETFSKLGYLWYSDRPNLIGIRSTMDMPDVFNDIFAISWIQSKIPDGIQVKVIQNWLNRNLYTGQNGSKLAETGQVDMDTQFAINSYKSTVGTERFKFYTMTTDPGVYWLNHPMNNLGTSVMKPGQYQNCWSLGYHRGQQDHPALVQTEPITVYRDKDLDNTAEETGTTQTGLFGINIHGASKTGTSQRIDRWSAGCQVFSSRKDLFDVLALLHLYRKVTNNKFTYTLLKESQLQ